MSSLNLWEASFFIVLDEPTLNAGLDGIWDAIKR